MLRCVRERLLDANLNRARRVAHLGRVGEVASRRCGSCRGLSHTSPSLGELGEAQLPDLLPQRSAATDPGLAPELAAGPRQDLSGVAAAAAGRVGESLRVLEEVGSTVSPAFSAGVQAIRHGWYDVDRDLRLRLGTRKPVVQPRLCVLLTRALCPGGDWVRIVDALAEAGVDMVQIREKSCSDGELLRHAEVVRSKLPSATRLVINDRVAVAATLGLDVHLGREDLPTLAARQILGRDAQIGRSTSGLAEAQQAVAEGPDLVGVGPMFVSVTKDKPPVGPAAVGMVASARSLTWPSEASIFRTLTSSVNTAQQEWRCVAAFWRPLMWRARFTPFSHALDWSPRGRHAAERSIGHVVGHRDEFGRAGFGLRLLGVYQQRSSRPSAFAPRRPCVSRTPTGIFEKC